MIYVSRFFYCWNKALGWESILASSNIVLSTKMCDVNRL